MPDLATKIGLTLLAEHAPPWFQVRNFDAVSLSGTVMYAGLSSPAASLCLLLSPMEAFVRVREESPGSVLPASCPDRHIEGDGNFCTGLDKVEVVSGPAAVVWWSRLEAYLNLQSVADRTGVWPDRYALDHGYDAPRFQTKAQQLAAEHGWSEEYIAARLGEASWITNEACRNFGRDSDRIDERCPCPRGCRTAAGEIILRAGCNKRDAVDELIRLEHQRRQALEEFWLSVRRYRPGCCRRLSCCPLMEPPPVTEKED